MASRSLNMVWSTPNWSYTVFRAPSTPASGGTAITTKPTTDEYGNNQKDFIKQLNGACSALISDLAANGAPTTNLSINMIDTAGVFTYRVQRDGTQASGGTAITTKPTTTEAALDTRDFRKMLYGAASALKSDRAAND